MNEAFKEALKAKEISEVPIGCVIVYQNKIIGSGFNKRNIKKNVLYHSEIIAINEACSYMDDWRLENCTIFVTLEPCAMCAGAILQSRMERLVYSTKNPKGGSISSINNVLNNNLYNHKVEIISGVMEKESAELISNFFSNLRSRKFQNS